MLRTLLVLHHFLFSRNKKIKKIGKTQANKKGMTKTSTSCLLLLQLCAMAATEPSADEPALAQCTSGAADGSVSISKNNSNNSSP